jgi:protease-4
MTAEEKEMMLAIIDSIYERFVEIVSKGRKMDRKDVEKVADGGVYNASKAKELGLIDQIGYREDSLAVACKLANIKSAALVKSYSKKGFAEVLSEMASMNSGAPTLINEFRKMMESSEVPALMFKMSMPLSN